MDMIYMKERTRDFYFYTLFGVPYNIAKELPAEDKITALLSVQESSYAEKCAVCEWEIASIRRDIEIIVP